MGSVWESHQRLFVCLGVDEVFDDGVWQDLAGMATSNTAKGLQKAHMMFEACRQFGALR